MSAPTAGRASGPARLALVGASTGASSGASANAGRVVGRIGASMPAHPPAGRAAAVAPWGAPVLEACAAALGRGVARALVGGARGRRLPEFVIDDGAPAPAVDRVPGVAPRPVRLPVDAGSAPAVSCGRARARLHLVRGGPDGG